MVISPAPQDCWLSAGRVKDINALSVKIPATGTALGESGTTPPGLFVALN